MAMIDFFAPTPALDAVKAVGKVAKDMPAPAGPGGSGSGMTKFSIDPEQAQKLITGLREAREKLKELYENAETLRNSGAPAKDPYSGMATLAIRNAAGDNPGGYGKANLDARTALDKTIENIDKALAKYRQTDEAASAALNNKG